MERYTEYHSGKAVIKDKSKKTKPFCRILEELEKVMEDGRKES